MPTLPVHEENLEKIEQTFRARETVDKYAYRASKSEIVENDFNLNIPRYVDTVEEEEEIDLMTVRKERDQLKAEMDGLETRMQGYLRELGWT